MELASGISVTLSRDLVSFSGPWSCAAAFCSSSFTGFFLSLGGIEDLEDE